MSTHGVAFAQWNCERMEHSLPAERSDLQSLRIMMSKVLRVIADECCFRQPR